MLPERLHQYFHCMGLIFLLLQEIAMVLASKGQYPVLSAVVPSGALRACKGLIGGILALVVEFAHHIASLLSNIYIHSLYIIWYYI